MEPFDCAWFDCCRSGLIPSDDNGIPTCNSNVTRSAVGLSQAERCWKQMRTHLPKCRECLFLKSPEHIYVHEMLYLYSHSMQVLWSGHFCVIKTRFVDVLTWVFMMGRPRQIDHSPKRTDLRWYATVEIHHGTCVPISKPCFEYVVQCHCEFHDITSRMCFVIHLCPF